MSLRLIVMRHAKSSWKTEAGSDHERPLNKRGRAGAPEIAIQLRDREWCPQLVLSSDSARTQETFRLMEPILPETEVIFSRSLYLAGLAEIRTLVAEHDPCVETLLVLGHNPGWQEVVSHLSNSSVVMKTAHAAVLEHPGDAWCTHLEELGRWRLVEVLTPSPSE